LQRPSENEDYNKIEFSNLTNLSGEYFVPDLDSDLPPRSPSEPAAPTTLVEHFVSIAMGGLLLTIGVSLFGWGVQLAVAGGQSPAGWPPGMGKLLLPVALTALAVGIGSWRLLLISLPQGIAGISLGKWIAGLFVLAAAVGALL
jgi:hypothetical protein